jgi:hypothetical protein
MPWYANISRHLSFREDPPEYRSKFIFTHMYRCYMMLSGVLYRKGFNSVLRYCMDCPEIDIVLHETHNTNSGGHFGSHATLNKILCMGYFWLTM